MEFIINRLHTNLGIFRLKGTVAKQGELTEFSVDSAEYMGTDGWQHLDLNKQESQKLLKQIHNDILGQLTPDS